MILLTMYLGCTFGVRGADGFVLLPVTDWVLEEKVVLLRGFNGRYAIVLPSSAPVCRED